MKKNIIRTLSALTASCNKQTSKMDELPAGADSLSLNIKVAYVNVDSLQNNYELYTVISDSLLGMEVRRQKRVNDLAGRLDNERRRIEEKLKNNRYFSEDEFNRDQRNFAAMQKNSEQEIANLNSAMEEKAKELQQILKDSVDNFLTEYNKTKQYDMILRNEVVLYTLPKYDITQDVINGLNKRYKK